MMNSFFESFSVLIITCILLLTIIYFDDYFERRSIRRWNEKNKDMLLRVTRKYIEIENHQDNLKDVFYLSLVYPENGEVVPITVSVFHFEYDKVKEGDTVKLQYLRNNEKSEYYPSIKIVTDEQK